MFGIPDIDRRTLLKATSGAVLGSYAGGAASAEGRDDGALGDVDAADVIAHRGFAGVYPENTVGAVENASRGGRADMIEIDVVPCGGRPREGDDFEVVVFHDDRLAQRDGGERGLTDHENALVWDTPCSEVQNAEVLESGETVPTLRDVLEAIPPSVGVNIELKNPGDTDVRFAERLECDELEARKDVWRPFTRRTLDVASEFENHVLVSSFMEAALATTREYDSSIPIGFLFWDSIEVGLEITDEYDCEALHPPYNMVAGTPFFNDAYLIDDPGFADVDLVERAHDEGRDVNTWTIGTWYQAEQLVDAGVDGIIADYPGLLD